MQHVGKYEILGEIGQGAMGVVRKAAFITSASSRVDSRAASMEPVASIASRSTTDRAKRLRNIVALLHIAYR